MDSGLYIHIPFCKKKCIYCDFYSVEHQESMFDSFLDALRAELTYRVRQFPDFSPSTVFIGGGTPTVLSAVQLASLGYLIGDSIDISNISEFTFEANPGTLTPQKLEAMLSAGATRLSLGLQSADDRILKAIGRIHTFSQFAANMKEARHAGFKDINIDLMFGLPFQTVEILDSTLSSVLELEPEHVSAYSLTVEESTPIARALEEGTLTLPGEELERSMYDRVLCTLKQFGYKHYEISNWAKPGLECRHNLIYWQGGNYIGLGPGAHSLYGNRRFFNPSDTPHYIADWSQNHDTAVTEEMLDTAGHISEFMITGLRLVDGISRTDFIHRFGFSLDSLFGNQIKSLQKRGLIASDGDKIRLSRTGLDLGNQVFMEFI